MNANRRCLILYLMEYFEDNKGEKVMLKDISAHLDSLGISVARKALYQEIDALRDYGMIIDGFMGRNAAYIFVGWGMIP